MKINHIYFQLISSTKSNCFEIDYTVKNRSFIVTTRKEFSQVLLSCDYNRTIWLAERGMEILTLANFYELLMELNEYSYICFRFLSTSEAPKVRDMKDARCNAFLYLKIKYALYSFEMLTCHSLGKCAMVNYTWIFINIYSLS